MYEYQGVSRDGMHIKISKKGNVKRVVCADGNIKELKTINLIEELMLVGNTDNTAYIIAVNHIEKLYNEFKDAEDEDVVNAWNKFENAVGIMIEILYENDECWGYLTDMTVTSYMALSADTPIIEVANHIVEIFHHWLFVSTEFAFLLEDLSKGNKPDFEERCKIFGYCEITLAITRTNNGLEKEYYVRNLLEYFAILVNYFLDMNLNIQRCKCCGDFFVAKTKRKTLYCDRVLKNGRTCKEYGPKLSQRIQAKNDEILGAYDKAKNKMYKRMERLELFGETEKSISRSDYLYWLDKAQKAKQYYLDGKISAEEALDVINSESCN